MITKDGQYEVYMFQFKTDSEGDDWEDVTSDDFKNLPPGFTDKDKCHQLTGINGAFKLSQAYSGLEKLRKIHPNISFRIIFVEISQRTRIIPDL